MTDVGTDALFDPATSTMYVAKSDALVAILAGTPDQTPDARLVLETLIGKLIASRI